MEKQEQNQSEVITSVIPTPLSLLDIRNSLQEQISFFNDKKKTSSLDAYIPKFWNTVAILLNAKSSRQNICINDVNYFVGDYKLSANSDLANAVSVGRIYLFENVREFIDDMEVLSRIKIPAFDGLQPNDALTPDQFSRVYEWYAEMLKKQFNPQQIVIEDVSISQVAAFFVTEDSLAITGAQSPRVSVISSRLLGLYNFDLIQYAITTRVRPLNFDSVNILFGGE